MSGLPLRARVFLWVVLLTTVGVAASAITQVDGRLWSTLGFATLPDAVTNVLAGLAIILAGLYPICLGNKIRTSVSAVITFAAALLFPPLRAMAIVLPASLVYTSINSRRSGWPAYYIAFNSAQITLNTAITASLFHQMEPVNGSLLHLGNPIAVGAVAVAIACYFALNSGMVAAMSALVQSQPLPRIWLSMYRHTWHRSVSVLLLGAALAIIYLYAPVGVLLFAIPLAVIHQAYSNSVTIQTQTKQTLEILADAIDKRDPHTYAHSQRVSEYARLTAQRLGLTPEQQEAITLAARVHDLGKIGVREDLLKRPGQLTDMELEEIRRHTIIGADIVSKLADYSNSKDAILYHHERWDGSGIHRLAYEHIPIGARIIAVADAFDAMTSDRPYRRALERQAAWKELEKGKGSQFDPVVVEAFIDVTKHVEITVPVAPTSEPDVRLPHPATTAQVQH